MEKPAEENEIIKFLRTELKVKKKDAEKVIEVLSSDKGDLDAKIRKLKKLNLKNIDEIVTSICVFMVDDSIITSYFRVMAENKHEIVKMILDPQDELRDSILMLSSVLQCKAQASTDKLGILFLILPILRLTGVIPTDIMVKLLQMLSKEYSISLKRLLQVSNAATVLFLEDTPQEIPQSAPLSETIH